MEQNKEVKLEKSESIFEEIFENKGKEAETTEGQLWVESDGSQSKLFRNVGIGSFVAGIVIGGILIFFFGQYM